MPFLRLIEEVGRPVLRSATYLLSEANQLPQLAAIQPTLRDGRPAPMMLNGKDVKVQFSTPLTHVQQLARAERVVRWREYSTDPADPAAWPNAVRTEEIPVELNDALAAPAHLLRSEEERADRAEQSREMQMGAAQPQETAAWT